MAPILSLSHFTDGSYAERQNFAVGLTEGLKQYGFVKIIDHGISDVQVEESFERVLKLKNHWCHILIQYQFKSFFALPIEERDKVKNLPGPNPQRGWSSLGAESTASLYTKGLLGKQVDENLKDAREHWDQGSKQDIDYPNRWLPDHVLPDFRRYMEAQFETLEKISGSILSALEVGLKLPHGSFTERVTHSKNASEFRCNYYPTINMADIRKGSLNRIWPHFDLGVITLLFQDQVGGLEFEDRTRPGRYDAVECGQPSELVVNVSETLQRWTNGVLPAGLHRVSPPSTLIEEESGALPPRYSIAYFTKADRSALVGPLEQFITTGRKPEYADMTALEYHRSRLLSAY